MTAKLILSNVSSSPSTSGVSHGKEDSCSAIGGCLSFHFDSEDRWNDSFGSRSARHEGRIIKEGIKLVDFMI